MTSLRQSAQDRSLRRGAPERDRLTAPDVLTPAAVVGLTVIGFFKGSEWLEWTPIDLTVLLAGIAAMLTASALLTTYGQTKVSVWAVLFVATCVPAALYAMGSSAAFDKRVRLLITLLVVVAAAVLVRSYRRQQVWVWLHVLVGVALVASGHGDLTSRFSAAGSNTIAAGRASGVAIVVLVLMVFSGGIGRWWMKLAALGVIVWLTTALIQTGSRGPVLACAATIVFVALLSPGRGRLFRTAAAVSAVVAGWLMLADATGVGANRITGSLSGQYSLTESRAGLWRLAWKAIPEHPFGVGWGNFANVLPSWAQLDSGYVQYPHNVVLEISTEAGWLAGIGCIVVLVASVRRLAKIANQPYTVAILGILVFSVLNAMVSGDVNDNRMMWAAVGLAWVAQHRSTDEKSKAPARVGAVQDRQSTSSGAASDVTHE